MILNVEPYIGALPIRFGMTPAEVEAVVGPASSTLPGVLGTTVEERPNLMIGYTQTGNIVYEVNCHVGTTLMFKNHDLFNHPDLIAFLRQFDPNPMLWVGFVIFLQLGIQLSGFHDEDESQKSISMVMRETWADFEGDFSPFDR